MLLRSYEPEARLWGVPVAWVRWGLEAATVSSALLKARIELTEVLTFGVRSQFLGCEPNLCACCWECHAAIKCFFICKMN